MSAEVCAPADAPLAVHVYQAAKVARWLQHCGGVAVWGSLDLADSSREWLTPARLTDGSPSNRPHWSSPQQPKRIVTDIGQVYVVTHREVARVRIAIRRGSYGLRWKLTDASSTRLRRALEKAGPTAVYVFEGIHAIVHVEASRTPLAEWLREHPDAGP
ncbi:MAG: hypothetical protein GC168_14920 [Candidatus Hydrogenedens sp.]|nr:hypothetical protein [Candidatus Hydrogenedens sp.]